MANEDSVTVSFRLNLNREEDWEIHRYLEDETAMFCFGDKSKFIKKGVCQVKCVSSFLHLFPQLSAV